MNEVVERFFAELHAAVMKPLGFKKLRHTFVRHLVDRTEYVNFQGSNWNDRGSPWIYYVNVGIEFLDVPPRSNESSWFKRVHASGRSNRILPASAPRYELDESTYDDNLRRIAELMPNLLDAIPRHLPEIRQRAQAGLGSQIPPQN